LANASNNVNQAGLSAGQWSARGQASEVGIGRLTGFCTKNDRGPEGSFLTTDFTDGTDGIAVFSYPCHPCHPWSNSLAGFLFVGTGKRGESQKNGVRKMARFYVSDPIFLTPEKFVHGRAIVRPRKLVFAVQPDFEQGQWWQTYSPD
jgi:hypothetical protein